MQNLQHEKTTMKQLQIIDRLDSIWEKVEGIDVALLYGSFGRNEHTVNSDIDIQTIIDDSFDVANLKTELKKEFGDDIIYINDVKLRNKIVLYFHTTPKLEISFCKDVSEIDRNYLGSEIINFSETILYQRVPSLYDIGSYLSQLIRDHKGINVKDKRKKEIEELVCKFLYEFESCSSSHRRSDGYKFYFFYNIALNCVVQLRHFLFEDTRFNFLPKYFIPGLQDKDEMNNIYELNGSLFLPDANKKKRKLLNYFYEVLKKHNYANIDSAREFLENIYKRDYFWNFRDIAKHNSLIRQGVLFRTATLSVFQDDDDFLNLIEGAKIKTIIDLRAEKEIAELPYKEETISQINYVCTPLDPWNQPEWFKQKHNQGTNEEIAYRFFALGCKDKIRQAIKAIVTENRGATAVHCFAGKDRTGIFISMLHLLTEAPMQIIYDDYLASEVDVKKERLDIVLDIIQEHGGIVPYFKSCELTNDEIKSLKTKLSYGSN
jgi:protein tyrosine/serine phosphatase/predicted nucleotidyltransferase